MSVCYAKTVEPIEMLFGANSRVGPRNCGAMGCLLVPLGEYDKMVCAAAAVQAVATITFATYYYFASECDAKYCNQRVCASTVCVCLLACPRIDMSTPNLHRSKLYEIFYGYGSVLTSTSLQFTVYFRFYG